jgi:hypothetical protein
MSQASQPNPRRDCAPASPRVTTAIRAVHLQEIRSYASDRAQLVSCRSPAAAAAGGFTALAEHTKEGQLLTHSTRKQ